MKVANMAEVLSFTFSQVTFKNTDDILYFFNSVQAPVAYFRCHEKLLNKVQSFNKITTFV